MKEILLILGLIFSGVAPAKVTEYAPGLGGINCQEPCNITASGAPVEPGVTAACGPDYPFGTQVYIPGYGWRTCQDRGGMIENGEVDIAVEVEDLTWWSGVVWVIWKF